MLHWGLGQENITGQFNALLDAACCDYADCKLVCKYCNSVVPLKQSILYTPVWWLWKDLQSETVSETVTRSNISFYAYLHKIRLCVTMQIKLKVCWSFLAPIFNSDVYYIEYITTTTKGLLKSIYKPMYTLCYIISPDGVYILSLIM